MTNDTSTLNGALMELGETFADNLTAQGVPSSASEGLTTLAGKILTIGDTGTITLTTNKSILSYYDNESATLTATYSKGAGYPLAVYNAVTGTKIGDMTDNQDGTYSYTYSSTGVGDISMTAITGTTESDSITIEDTVFYTEQEYSYTNSGQGVYAYMDSNLALTLPTNCEISMECKCTGGTTNNEHRYFLTPKSTSSLSSQPSKGIYWENAGGNAGHCGYRDNSTITISNNLSFPTDTYIPLTITKNGTTVKICMNQCATGTINYLNDNYTDWTFLYALWNQGTAWIKNIKIKAI